MFFVSNKFAEMPTHMESTWRRVTFLRQMCSTLSGYVDSTFVLLMCSVGALYVYLPDYSCTCFFGINARSLISSTAAMDVPVLYAPTAFDNASLSVPEVKLLPCDCYLKLCYLSVCGQSVEINLIMVLHAKNIVKISRVYSYIFVYLLHSRGMLTGNLQAITTC